MVPHPSSIGLQQVLVVPIEQGFGDVVKQLAGMMK